MQKRRVNKILLVSSLILLIVAGLLFFRFTGFAIKSYDKQLAVNMKFEGDLKNSVNNQAAKGNNIQFTTGKIGKAGYFIENSLLELPISAAGDYAMAISFWINREKKDEKKSYDLIKFSSNPKTKQTWSDYSIVFNEDSDFRKIYVSEKFSKGSDYYQCNYFINSQSSDRNKISDGEWHQIVISFIGKSYADRVLYFDGSPVRCQLTKSRTITGANLLFSSTNFKIGSNQFKGLIDELKIWKAPLPAADMIDLYLQESAPVIEKGKESCFVEFEISEEKLQEVNWCNGADFNHDGIVDSKDTAIWTANKNKQGSQEQGDANNDGKVDTKDYNVLRANANKKDCDKPKIKFTLAGTRSLYGIYSGFVNQFNKDIPEDYVLGVYNNLNKLAGTYSASSSRFIFWDNFEDSENPGGIIEENSGTISVVVPYLANMKTLRVSYGGQITDLQISTNVKCQRTCKIENELVNLENSRCCVDYIAAQQDNGDYYCVKCGDGKVSRYESYYSCYEDFTEISTTTPSTPATPATPETPTVPQGACTKNSDCTAQTGMTARCLATTTGNKCAYYKGACYPGMACQIISSITGTCQNLIPGSTVSTGNYQCTYGTCTTNSNCVSGTKCSSQKCVKI